MAEGRVSKRPMLPGETYADFAASLRDLWGINRKYRQNYSAIGAAGARPKTLGETVDKATEINDPIDNVAQGMKNIGQAFVTAPSSYLVPAEETTGQMMIIPGIGGVEATDGKPANFLHEYTGLWEAPKGMQWGGNKWVRATRKRATPVTTTVVGKAPAAHLTEKTAKARMVRMARDEDSEDDTEAGVTTLPPAKKRKAVVRQVKPVKQPTTGSELQRSTEGEKPAYRSMSERSALHVATWVTLQGNVHMKTRALVTTNIWPGEASKRNLWETWIKCRRSRCSFVQRTPQQKSEAKVGKFKMKPNDGSMTTVARAAVDAHLDEEVTARDHGRAERYVATVWPAMAALRYVLAHEVHDGVNGRRDEAVSERPSCRDLGVPDEDSNTDGRQ
ncbi:LOW QUALITY PROTEIN: hypothetical protein PHMEG_00021618 [Phytophthora megakarya]|uniref:Uncharacterized protein n=1 Tax=Phytophthora megakarya TaxID=4795 RepID=A0A225VLF2_9STRA|nr:LOW QUALITY PROTEIN: hypothetical protein PHMEG_00021618 [Phytophthora megakarya]